MKVVLNRNECIGCGGCVAICPKNFKMGDDGKSELIDSKKSDNNDMEKEIDKPGCILDAANGCPVQCIHISK
ncbi:MAG: ferredoxin [Candidatus Nealsonbacteria bacterium]|nr:ferredoxin [Candidatus Nealsonbacteria bacterium]